MTDPGASRSLFISRPTRHWLFGGFLVALLAVFVIGILREGRLQADPDAWVAYVVVTLFGTIALWMLGRPAIRLDFDPVQRELVHRTSGLFGRGPETRVRLSSLKGVSVLTDSTGEDDVYLVALEVDGRSPLPVTPKMNSSSRCRSAAAAIEERLRPLG